MQWLESLLVIILDGFYDTVFIFLLFTQIQSGKDDGIGLTQHTIPVVILKWSDLSSFISSTFFADILNSNGSEKDCTAAKGLGRMAGRRTLSNWQTALGPEIVICM